MVLILKSLKRALSGSKEFAERLISFVQIMQRAIKTINLLAFYIWNENNAFVGLCKN